MGKGGGNVVSCFTSYQPSSASKAQQASPVQGIDAFACARLGLTFRPPFGLIVDSQLQKQFLCGDLDRLAPKACSLRYDNDDQAGRSLRTQIADEILCFVA